jgi:hypothetical protein
MTHIVALGRTRGTPDDAALDALNRELLLCRETVRIGRELEPERRT